MAKGNVLVGQSGGPTSVINSSLAGVIDAAMKADGIGRVFGMRFGIEGVLQDNLVDLGSESPEVLKGLRSTPGSALGSSRLKLKDEHFPAVLKQLQKYDIRYYFMIGGNDTMDTIHRVTQYANDNGHEMIGVGVPKTVDNDLHGTDHTPGYPSAARYVALSVLQAGILARDMKKVDQFVIHQSIGRSAGWLPAAAACAPGSAAILRRTCCCFPNVRSTAICFWRRWRKRTRTHGFVSIVCGEGITSADGTPVSVSQTRDKFGNIEFGAMGGTSAAMILHRIISDEFGWRGEFQVTESLPMCGADRGVKLDFDEAFACGQQAVKLAIGGEGGVMVTLNRLNKPGEKYEIGFGTISLSEVANHERPMPDNFITENGFGVTSAFLDYVEPLVGPMPTYSTLSARRAEP